MPQTRPLDPTASFAACLGALLRRLRTHHGLTQAALGHLAGYHGSYIGAVERAAVRPTHDLIGRCDHALHANGALLSIWPLADHEWTTRTAPTPRFPPPPAAGRDSGDQPWFGQAAGEADSDLCPYGDRATYGSHDRDRPGRPGRPGEVDGGTDGLLDRGTGGLLDRWGHGALDRGADGVLDREGQGLDDRGADGALDAMEVARLAEASEVGAGTLAGVERAVQRLREAAGGMPPEMLIPAVRAHRRYVGRLLERRVTLGRHRRLLVAAGWLSVLLAQLCFDAGDREAAEANRDVAFRLARQTGHAELAAWAVEALAAWALADGRPQDALELAGAGQDLAPPVSLAALQLALDEAQAWASLGDHRQAAAARRQAALTTAMLPGPSSAHRAVPDLALAGTAAS